MLIKTIMLWSGIGTVFALAAIVTAHYAGPQIARELGEAGGEGFAQAVARVQHEAQAMVSGRWSQFS